MKKRILLVLSLLLVCCLATSCAYLPIDGFSSMTGASGVKSTTTSDNGDTVTISKEQYEKYRQFDKLIEMMDTADQYFYQEVDHEAMMLGAAAGLLTGLDDPYSFYYTPEDYATLWEDDEGEYAGVGIQISASYVTGLCTVSRVFDNGPAREAGVHKGDILYRVEDLYVSATNLEDAVDIMRGTPGTDVEVVFLRGAEELTFTLTRAKINVNRVEATMLEDGIGYIYLYEFAGDCSARFTEELDKLVAAGAKGIIMDLRDNPGGWTDDAEKIADLFLDKGVTYYLEYKNGQKEYVFTANGKQNVKLVILINENSASSSEILAGALKDRADATLVGVQSYGKGIVQAVLPVASDGSGMQLTIAQYFTPNGNKVHKIGLTPDVEIKLPDGDNGMYEFADLQDPQLARALEVMREKLAN